MSRTTAPVSLPSPLDASYDDLVTRLVKHGYQPGPVLTETGLPAHARRHLFFLLGYLAKADGRVTEKDIGYAESLIRALALTPGQRKRAIKRFQQGKQCSQLSRWQAWRLRLNWRWRPEAVVVIALCLCHGAQLLGLPSKQRRYRCEDAVDALGLDAGLVAEVLDSYGNQGGQQNAERFPPPQTYQDACRILGVGRRDSLTLIKQTYRKQVSRCHPDKLARDLPPRELAYAKERLLRYQQAWEVVQRYHRHQAEQK